MSSLRGCPLCGHFGYPQPDPHSTALRMCRDCDLVFTDNRTDATARYGEAYLGGDSDEDIMAHLATTLPWPSQSAQFAEASHFLTLAQHAAIRRIPKIVPPPGPLLDLGCGPGWFAGAARLSGYMPYAMDVAPAAVELVRSKGIVAAVGTQEDIPADWPVPAVISMFEVIEHLADPLATVSSICHRFPGSHFVASVPSEQRWTMLFGRGEWDYPPNHLTRWSPQALTRLFQDSGYARVEVVRLPPTAYEIARVSIRWMLHARLGHWEPRLWAGSAAVQQIRPIADELRARRLKEILARPLEIPLRLLRRTALSWLVVASPSK